MKLRPYQEEARSAVQNEWQNNKKKTLLVLPTGCGKTIVFSKIIEDRVRAGERVLVLAHRGELLDQASDKLEKSTGLKTAIEKADQTSIGSFFRVVVGSVQTMQREKRLNKFPPDYFDTIVIDEAHHCISEGYQRVLKHFDESNVLGVTATPDRG
ncbi:MAG: DEAD/DEAH box helicase family protein, partial [Enterococcus faecalis]|nr:DEAD/DEAH box helicase family protein [Enterococcus faecalis]MDU2350650.1 DEAD/DEAH box helicase family protein [Enterococcus faecalis]